MDHLGLNNINSFQFKPIFSQNSSFSLKEHMFHYLNSEGLTFLCLTHEDVSQNSAFSVF
jgi:hypothetical protein